MEISEVRVKLVERASERLKAFCSITLDGDFVIRDLKIIDGANGLFVAMPSRKLADRCSRCGTKNHLRARFCNECGARLGENRAPKDGDGRAKLHADVAHPINALCRERIQTAVIEAFEAETERAKSPDYRPPSFDDFDDDDFGFHQEQPAPAKAGSTRDETAANTEEEEGEPIEVGDDYSSLIADLKKEASGRRDGGGERAPRDRRNSGRGRERQPAEGRTSSGERRHDDKPRDRGDRRGTGPHRGDRDRPPRREDRREETPAAQESPPPPPAPQTPPDEPAPAVSRPSREPKKEDTDDAFGAGLF